MAVQIHQTITIVNIAKLIPLTLSIAAVTAVHAAKVPAAISNSKAVIVNAGLPDPAAIIAKKQVPIYATTRYATGQLRTPKQPKITFAL